MTTFTRASIVQFTCRHCGLPNEYKTPMVSVGMLRTERELRERSEAALEDIRANVLQTEGAKAVAIADAALKGKK